ncbi:hypothetical protein [uncultured Rikenella sp.]|uniref:hypothetical protein n=1 Tax=uncultured Rikenella sp. TaxID=368003 RepID=UPI0026071905|nr:hypothetical protein [uncultured Rikenella sp.]
MALSLGPNGPAPGYRSLNTGTLSDVSNSGFSWCSATSGIHGVYLNFGVTWLNPGLANNRAYGFQLRCLSE